MLKMCEIYFCPGVCPDPAGEAYVACRATPKLARNGNIPSLFPTPLGVVSRPSGPQILTTYRRHGQSTSDLVTLYRYTDTNEQCEQLLHYPACATVTS